MESTSSKPTPGESGQAEPDSITDRLMESELYWRDRYVWLQSIGYRLHRRYEPDWVPSWIGTKNISVFSEDGQLLSVSWQN
jgi:hypothetical protein